MGLILKTNIWKAKLGKIFYKAGSVGEKWNKNGSHAIAVFGLIHRVISTT